MTLFFMTTVLLLAVKKLEAVEASCTIHEGSIFTWDFQEYEINYCVPDINGIEDKNFTI